jgi:hypothetical protein
MPLIKCPDCGNEVSDQAATCIKCGRPIAAPQQPSPAAGESPVPWMRWFVVLVIIVIAFFLLTGRNPVDFLYSVSPKVMADITCEATLSGMNCRMTRRSGSGAAKICWDVEFACANRTKASAHACEDVPTGIGSMSTRSISWDEFVGFKQCDQILTTRVVQSQPKD